MINIIAAISKNNVIGKDNSLLWYLPNDLKRFRKITNGATVIMGRKTYESIGHPLKNRQNIILSKNLNLNIDNCEISNSLDDAIYKAKNEIFIIGGGEIYKKSIEYADKLYITEVDCIVDGDSYFPIIDDNWQIVNEENFNKDSNHIYNYRYIEYIRKN